MGGTASTREMFRPPIPILFFFLQIHAIHLIH